MMTVVSIRVVTSMIVAVEKTNFLVIACFLSFMTLVVVVSEDTLIALLSQRSITDKGFT